MAAFVAVVEICQEDVCAGVEAFDYVFAEESSLDVLVSNGGWSWNGMLEVVAESLPAWLVSKLVCSARQSV